MSREICGIIVPRLEAAFMQVDDRCDAECLRQPGHWDERHVFKTRNGYVVWQDDLLCGCCEPDEDSRCFTYSEIDEAEAKALIESRDR
jgi:hypothetical protein